MQAFNERLQALEPEARTFGEALAETLAEIYPAAAEAGAATLDAAGSAAAGAAEIVP